MLKAYAKVKISLNPNLFAKNLLQTENFSLVVNLKSTKMPNQFQAAIRTDPEDLLKWTAEYFRCLSENEPVPYKKKVV